ncbi:MAG: HD domain-containing protein [Candidatus Saccharibacteria bacterium]|nr:HD domain-containing protein [Candidatus Saccharibacteria bacterium]
MPKQRPSIDRIAELQQLIADFACIERVLNLADKNRPENDVDHSYGLALTVWFLAPKLAPELSQEKVLKYALAHDIVELHAGDTFVFAPEDQLSTKNDREDKALKQLAKEWPDFPELIDYARGYKDKRDEEAKFVYAVDKILPPILINLGEKSDYWRKHKITKQMHNDKKRTILVSKHLKPYYQMLLDWTDSPNYFHNPEQEKSSTKK